MTCIYGLAGGAITDLIPGSALSMLARPASSLQRVWLQRGPRQEIMV